MNYIYLDSSVVLRYAFRQPERLDLRRRTELPLASSLLEVECLRVLDRARLETGTDSARLERRAAILSQVLARVELIAVAPPILRRAAAPLPVPLGTLDALHLATLLAWRESHEEPVTLATHDRLLARAARLHGLAVIGAAL